MDVKKYFKTYSPYGSDHLNKSVFDGEAMIRFAESYHQAKSSEEAKVRYERAIDESYCYLIEKGLMPKKAKFQIAIQDALRLSARIASGKGEDPKVNLKKVEVNEGAMDVEIESEEIVRFYVEHMKELFDAVKGADNYYTLTMKFAGDGKQYTITFQRHPGKTPMQIYDKRIQELEQKLTKCKEKE